MVDARPTPVYRAVALADGTLLPIEERIGRRLLRMLPVDSALAQELLREGRVEILRAADDDAVDH